MTLEIVTPNWQWQDSRSGRSYILFHKVSTLWSERKPNKPYCKRIAYLKARKRYTSDDAVQVYQD